MRIRTGILISCLALCIGCMPYRVPSLSWCHPACPTSSCCEIELSPVLDIDCESIPTIPSTAKKEEGMHHA